MKNSEGLDATSARDNVETGWEGVAAMADSERSHLVKYEVNSDGDVRFNKIGDEIIFGETKHTRKVDAFPSESYDDYHSSVVGIETYDGNCYFISEGVFVDKDNDKKIDLLRRRLRDDDFSFPNIRIGYQLPYEKISKNLKVPDGQGGTVVKVVSYGEASASHTEGSKMKKQIQDAIHGMILENDTAKQIRRIHLNGGDMR